MKNIQRLSEDRLDQCHRISVPPDQRLSEDLLELFSEERLEDRLELPAEDLLEFLEEDLSKDRPEPLEEGLSEDRLELLTDLFPEERPEEELMSSMSSSYELFSLRARCARRWLILRLFCSIA